MWWRKRFDFFLQDLVAVTTLVVVRVCDQQHRAASCALHLLLVSEEPNVTAFAGVASHGRLLVPSSDASER